MSTPEPEPRDTRDGPLDRLVAHPWFYVLIWVLTRATMAPATKLYTNQLVGDVQYYQWQVYQWQLSSALVEYPTPVAMVFTLLNRLVGSDPGAFLWVFVACMLALDAGMAVLVWRHGGPRASAAVLYWTAFIWCIGPLAYHRFDLVPAFLAGAAALYTVRRPVLSGVLVAVGAATKLWPALLALAGVGRDPKAVRRLAGFAVTGVVLAGVSLAAAGWDRLISPITWQSDRGLQVESVPATWLMVQRTFGNNQWTLALSKYNAVEIFGPSVSTVLTLSDVAFVLGLGVIAVLGIRTWRMSAATVSSAAAVMLAVVMVMIVTNKTLSPQYIVWIGAPVAVLVVASAGDGIGIAWPSWLAGSTLVIAGLTQQIYPVSYSDLINQAGTPMATATLAVRNVALVALAVASVRFAWTLTVPAADRVPLIADMDVIAREPEARRGIS